MLNNDSQVSGLIAQQMEVSIIKNGFIKKQTNETNKTNRLWGGHAWGGKDHEFCLTCWM